MAKDSKRVQPTQQPEQKYQREDLIWEAVRRNEEYKKAYKSLLKERSNDKKEISKWERLPWGLGYSLRWRMNGLLDPEISVDEIKEVIVSGDRLPEEVYPYYYLYKKKHPVIQFKVEKSIYVPSQIIKGYELSISDSDPSSFVMPKKLLENKVMIAIDPDAENNEIINEIKKIKKTARMHRKQELKRAIDRGLPWEIEDYDMDKDEDENDVENEIHREEENIGQSKINKRTYYPRDIEEYIAWLKKYDQIISEFKQKNNAEKLIVRYGALILPENCDVPDYIPTDNTKEYETTVRAYERAYAQAIALIQSAPDINFAPSRVQKDLEKNPHRKNKPRQKKRKPKKVRS